MNWADLQNLNEKTLNIDQLYNVKLIFLQIHFSKHVFGVIKSSKLKKSNIHYKFRHQSS